MRKLLVLLVIAVAAAYWMHRADLDTGFECGELLELHVAHPADKAFESALKHECPDIVNMNGIRVPSVFAPVKAEYRTVKAQVGDFFAKKQREDLMEVADRREACARYGMPGTFENVDVRGTHYDSIECSMDDVLQRPRGARSK